MQRGGLFAPLCVFHWVSRLCPYVLHAVPGEPNVYDDLQQLTVHVKAWFLEKYARQHRCPTCHALQTVGVDNKVSLRARLCCEATGHVRSYPAARVAVDFGCVQPPVLRGRHCARHAPLPSAEECDGPLLCPEDHGLVLESVPSSMFAYTCDVCSTTLPPGCQFYTCELGCAFDACCACYAGQHVRAAPAHPEAPDEHCEVVDIDPAWDSCGLRKLQPRGVQRGTGGLLSLVLPCGVVCHLAPCAGAESATQIYGLLAEVISKRQFKFVVYDNACMLHRFVNNVQRRLPCTSGNMLATQVRFVLDRFHKRNHRACLDPGHALYLPSVDVDRYPTLKDLNSAQSEQWNSWVGNFASSMRYMRFETLELYFFVVADLWNTTFPSQRAHAPAEAPRSRPPLLKRRRGQL